jgi:hypothetical protein
MWSLTESVAFLLFAVVLALVCDAVVAVERAEEAGSITSNGEGMMTEPMVVSQNGAPVPLTQMFKVEDFAATGLRSFLCPECAGTWFSSYDPHDGGEWIRSCKDQHGVGCKWRGRISEALDPDEDLSVHPLLRKGGPWASDAGGAP